MNNLRKLRGGASQDYIAKKLGVSQRTYSNYENGKTKLSKELLSKLSEIYNVSVDYILGVSDIPQTAKGIFIPVLGAVPAGIPLEAIEDIVDWEEITPEMAAMGEIFGLRVKGDSMAPMVLNGDTVIMRKQTYAENGDIVVVYCNGYEATLKCIKYDDKGIYLIPYNQTYEIQFFSKEDIRSKPVVICGKMLELRRKFY